VDTVVFLGPTLPREEARAILPAARFCPPVRCGDVLALMRLGQPPARIAIIDGNFEHVAAVWHKEILHALAAGVRVYGAASMGALRAAELCDHGMIGVGRVFADYRSGALVDDDEVALVHGAAAQGHRPLTDAMVNVRATLERAQRDGVIDRGFAERACAAAKQQFFQRRVLTDVVRGLDDEQAGRLLEWLPAGQVDVKRADALALLEQLRDEALAPATATPPAPAPSAFLRGLMAYVACRPLPMAADWLPPEERLARASRLFGEIYLLLQRLALARAFAAAAGAGGGPDDLAGARPAFALLLRAYGLYPAYRAGHDDAAHGIAVDLTARLACAWRRLELRLVERGVQPRPSADEVLAFARRFQHGHGLTTQPALDAWLQANDLTEPGAYAGFLTGWMAILRCLDPLACDLHGIAAIELSRNWFLETLQDSGLDRALADRAGAAGLASALRRRWVRADEAARDAFARACDLAGSADLELELRALERGP